MAFTVMLWLVNPGPQIYEDEAESYARNDRDILPGAMSGVTEPPAMTRLVYGVYDTDNQAAAALRDIEGQLAQGRPVTVTPRSGNVFLIPAHRVHYAVMAEVIRPKDEKDGRAEGTT